MNKILVPLPFDQWGGLHEIILTIYSELVKKGFLLIPLVPKNNKFIHNRFKSKKIRIIKANLTRPRKSFNLFLNIKFIFLILRDILLIGRIIKKEKIKIVQVSGIQNFHYLIAAKVYNCKLLCQIHSDALPKFFRYLFSPIVVLFADIVMCNGKYFAESYPVINKYINEKKFIYFYPGLNIKNFSFTNKQKSISKLSIKIPKKNLVIGTIGNQSKAKAHERIIDIITSLDAYKNINFLILGGYIKSNARYYKQKVLLPSEHKKLFNNRKLQIIDAKNNIKKFLPSFDIFIMTSKFEGMPIALIEAMASGLPIVTTNVGSIHEIIKNNINGFIPKSKEFNLNFFENSLKKLLIDKKIRKKFGERNRAIVIKKFTLENLVNAHFSAYKKLQSWININAVCLY